MKYLKLAHAAGTRLIAGSPRPVVKWVAWAVVALMPGSFMVIPVIWIARQIRAQAS